MASSPLSSLSLSVPDGFATRVRLTNDDDALRLEALEDLTGLATNWFNAPAVHAAIPVEVFGSGAELLGYSFGQFAWPVCGSRDRAFDFNPAANLNAMPAVLPLLIRSADGEVLLLAPLDAWHEQVIGVVQDERGVRELRWGWHGDLDEVKAGFTATLGVYRGPGPAEVLRRWGRDVLAAAGTRRPDPYHAPELSHLSYWTDNGAAYWYRTEPGLDLPTTIARKIDELDDLGVTVGAVELDSWFYPHEISRPISEVGYLDEVPPTGMLTWSPRPDVLPDGIEDLRARLGDRPLILHSRHISPVSPYVDDDWWVELTAQPSDPSFFRRWFADAARWGASAVEQDWMVMAWFGTRELRRVPGRARAWQHALDQAATDHDLSLIWCMATPADLMATVELSSVVAVRTSDDYRYAEDPARLWYWYLAVNRLVDAVDLVTFKDCFFSDAGSGPGDERFGVDPHAEVEALLSAFSGGVAGIGDRLGHTDPDIVARLCRPDGLLIKPDRPLALADQSFFRPYGDHHALCWAETTSGPWRYVVALHTASTEASIADEFMLDGEYLLYNWADGTATVGDRIVVELSHRGWVLIVCCPLEQAPGGGGRRALIGDPDRLVTMGSRRVEVADDGSARLVPAPGEHPEAPLWWYEAETPPLGRR